jgi:hypothetical protein
MSTKLLDVYNQMVKEAEEAEIAEDRAVELCKYAEAADQLLAAEYGDDYTEADVEKLAEKMFINDKTIEAEEAKVAEWQEAGRVMARAFIEELQTKEAEEK